MSRGAPTTSVGWGELANPNNRGCVSQPMLGFVPHPNLQQRATLVPTLPRGNPCLSQYRSDAKHSHAGAWERENMGYFQ